MPKVDCWNFHFPMNVPELTLHYISIPDKSTKFAVDFNSLK